RRLARDRARPRARRHAAAPRRSGRHPGVRGGSERIRDPALPSRIRPGPPARGHGPTAQAQMMASPAPVPSRPHVYRHFHRIAWLAVALTFGVIVFGAFVRLSDAGLSCPDWPTCYGRATWPQAAHEASDHAASAIRPFEDHKAWREQVHRHLAASLGVLVLVLALLAVRRRRFGIALVLGASALVAAAVPMYMRGLVVPALLVAGAGEALLLGAALAWMRANRTVAGRDLAPVGALALAVVVFQALLGQWTVTMLLKPVIVMGPVLGGMPTCSLGAWRAWRATHLAVVHADAVVLRRWLVAAIAVLGVQIALGGWVSANYAALSCGAGGWTTPEPHYL